MLLLLLAGCSNDDSDMSGAPEIKNSPTGKIRWYGGKIPDEPRTKGVADGAKRWNQNSGIYIKFLNTPSDPQIVERVKEVALEWERYAGIKFHFTDQSKETYVRIAFDWNDNDWLTWSYTGTDARLERDQTQPTAVLAGLEYLDDERFRGDVLRLFGQILGLEYEQRHEDWSINGYWRSETQLQRYWENQFEGYDMDWEELREHVFVPLTDENALELLKTREIDELSIMAWPYYSYQQTTKILANYELSEDDKAFIAQLYPKDEPSLPTIQEAWVDAGFFVWRDDTKTSLQMTDLGREQEYLPDVCDGEQLTSAYMMFNSYELKAAPMFNTSNIVNFEQMFYSCIILTSIPEYNTSKGLNFSWMFGRCGLLTTIPLLDTSNGTNFNYMFDRCTALTSIPFLDTSEGTQFVGMFGSCTTLTTIPLIDTSNGVDFFNMFQNCPALTDIPNLNTSKGTRFKGMFQRCIALTTIPLLDTSKGTDFEKMFDNCESLTTIPLLDISNGTNFHFMFNNCSSLTSIPNFNTSNGIFFSGMFSGCRLLTTIPLIDTSNGTNLSYMFQNCTALTSIPNLNTSKVEGFSGMFSNCTSLTSIPLIDTSKGGAFSSMFDNCILLTSIPPINTSRGFYFDYMFRNCRSLMVKPELDLSNATRTYGMYEGTPFE